MCVISCYKYFDPVIGMIKVYSCWLDILDYRSALHTRCETNTNLSVQRHLQFVNVIACAIVYLLTVKFLIVIMIVMVVYQDYRLKLLGYHKRCVIYE